MDGYGRRDVNGKANAGLTLGIIGTALGAWALFGNNRRSTGLLGAAGGGGMLGDGSTNINVVGAGIGAGTAAPSAFQAWAKSCEDTLALQGGLYQWALTQQNQRFQDRQVIDYVAINAQYHDYCELFEKWFGSNFDEKIIASAVDFWFEDDDFDGNKVWKYFNEM